MNFSNFPWNVNEGHYLRENTEENPPPTGCHDITEPSRCIISETKKSTSTGKIM